MVMRARRHSSALFWQEKTSLGSQAIPNSFANPARARTHLIEPCFFHTGQTPWKILGDDSARGLGFSLYFFPRAVSPRSQKQTQTVDPIFGSFIFLYYYICKRMSSPGNRTPGEPHRCVVPQSRGFTTGRSDFRFSTQSSLTKTNYHIDIHLSSGDSYFVWQHLPRRKRIFYSGRLIFR